MSAAASRLRAGLAAAFLLFQVGLMVRARFTEARYFCWAPFDSKNEYALEVVAAGRRLPDEEVRRRYGIPPRGTDHRSIQHVKDLVRQYEETYGRADDARVVLHYKTNGVEKRDWRCP
ncbi:MAG TPA: hypothetical protein VL404_06700 [Candidatus Eisenbacteria bacterium]|nr:hypothetical protein [Candidatus Eisenbacteria bacterium]